MPFEDTAAAPSLQSLDRGLSVIQAFDRQREMTLSEVARAVSISPAAVRRVLLSLQQLGYVRSDGRMFSLTPRILAFGWAYLGALHLDVTARETLDELAARTGETCSIGAVDGDEVVYPMRSPGTRVMAITMVAGQRLPLVDTAAGRAFLAAAEDPGPAGEALRPVLDDARRAGWALADGTLDSGVRSVAAIVREPSGAPILAVELSAPVARASLDDVQLRLAPEVVAAAAAVSRGIARHLADHPRQEHP